MRLDRIGMAMLAAYFLGRGPATTLPGVFLAYVKTEPHLPQPDLELLLQLPGASSYWFPGLTPPFRDGFGVKAYLTGQESLGEVRLKSADPNDRPLIRYNSLSAPSDLPKLRAAYKRLWELVHAPDLAPFRGKLVYPKAAPKDDAEIDAFLRSNASQQFHPASTCRMGGGPDAVLNPDLSVRGVEGLYVADASAMPRLVSGNPNVVIMMMAAKAASLWTGRPPA
jgi:choline dehydrogenase-like flavoprotein